METELTRTAAKAVFMKAFGAQLEAYGFREQASGRGLYEYVHTAPGGARYVFKGTFTRQGDFHPLLQVYYPEVTAFIGTVAPWIAERAGTAVFSTHFTDFLDADNSDGYLHSTGPHPYHPIPAPLTEPRMRQWAAELAAAWLPTALVPVLERTGSLEAAEALLNAENPVKPPRYRFAGSQRWMNSVLTRYVPVHFIMGLVLAHLLRRRNLPELRDGAANYLRRNRQVDNELFDLLQKVVDATAEG
ncbi:hypothetical protein [Flaviaesturariibacter amylovorans]|uniref:DUF4304 domain-containing protein n=1 Tax=Flaviaesturariibacter amylovorans TaxID=1084520 RepID=A0ABP8GY76_9BACT